MPRTGGIKPITTENWACHVFDALKSETIASLFVLLFIICRRVLFATPNRIKRTIDGQCRACVPPIDFEERFTQKPWQAVTLKPHSYQIIRRNEQYKEYKITIKKGYLPQFFFFNMGKSYTNVYQQ